MVNSSCRIEYRILLEIKEKMRDTKHYFSTYKTKQEEKTDINQCKSIFNHYVIKTVQIFWYLTLIRGYLAGIRQPENK